MIRTRITTLLVAVSCAAASACGGDSSTAPSNAKPAGAYELRQVDGNGLPAKIYHGPYFDETISHFYNQLIAEVTEGIIELNENGRFMIEVDYRFNCDGQMGFTTLEDEGEYQVENGEIQFLSDDGYEYSASIQKGTIDLDIPNALKEKQPNVRYSFRK